MNDKKERLDSYGDVVNDDAADKEPIPMRMWIAAVLVSLQSFQFGYAISCLNSALVTGDANDPQRCYDNTDDASPPCPPGTIYNDIQLSTLEAQIATSLAILGAWIGCYCGSQPAEKYGRRLIVLGTNIFFIIGGVLTAIGFNVATLYVGRFFVGFGVGIESVVVPVLLSEIASPASRGTITTLHQVQITLAIFISGIIGYGLVGFVDHGWQYLQAGMIIPSIIMIVLQKLVPESPKWLLMQSRAQDAMDMLTYLRADGWSVQAELTMLQLEASKESKVEKANVSWKEVFSNKRAVIIGCGLMFFGALSGINTVIFYSTTIFGFAGFDESILATASVGIVNFITTLSAAYYVDKMGRKTLLLAGLFAMLLALLLLSVILVAYNSNESAQGIIAVIATLIYVFGFAIGPGAVSWVIMSEIVPTRIRTKAFSLFVSINWGCNLIIGLLTLTAIDSLGGVTSDMTDDETSGAQKNGVAYLYFIFSGICFAGITFVKTYVPETKGKTLEELSDISGGNQEPLLNDRTLSDANDTSRF